MMSHQCVPSSVANSLQWDVGADCGIKSKATGLIRKHLLNEDARMFPELYVEFDDLANLCKNYWSDWWISSRALLIALRLTKINKCIFLCSRPMLWSAGFVIFTFFQKGFGGPQTLWTSLNENGFRKWSPLMPSGFINWSPNSRIRIWINNLFN